jgi:hypothetical protein
VPSREHDTFTEEYIPRGEDVEIGKTYFVKPLITSNVQNVLPLLYARPDF